MKIKKLTENYWSEVAKIFSDGIATKNATFRSEVPSWCQFDSTHHLHTRLVALENNKVIGWCALAPVSNRIEYSGVAEVSIYISLNHMGKGVGHLLMQQLIILSEENGIWTLYASLFPENEASIKLHKKNGFRQIGYREKIAQQDGIWRDTVLYERRSKKI